MWSSPNAVVGSLVTRKRSNVVLPARNPWPSLLSKSDCLVAKKRLKRHESTRYIIFGLPLSKLDYQGQLAELAD